MTVDFNLPHLGEGISTADIIKVHVKEGDKVEIDQIIIEIETDKATVEVPSEVAGIVKTVHVKEGQKANVGAPVISVETIGTINQELKQGKTKRQDEEVKSEKKNVKEEVIKPKSEDKPQTSSIYEFKIPILGENISSAQITKVLVKEGDKVEVDQIVFEIETDKATVEVPSEVAGKVKEVRVKDGDKVDVGSVALIIESLGGLIEENSKVKTEQILRAPKEQQVKEADQSVSEHTHMPQTKSVPKNIVQSIVPAAPSVRRFAREIGVDVHQVRGSGKSGRISIEDVKAYAKALNQQIQKGGIAVGGVGLSHQPLPDFSKWGEIERQSMSNIRRKTAEHLSYAWATIPHVTQFDKADITELEQLRKRFGKQVESSGGKLTVTGILVKVLASALKVFPQFNSSVDMEKNEIVYKKYYNIGIAVDTDRGLLVPVINNVDKKNITEISKELAEISVKARDKKLSLEEMQGGSITISNLGGIGGTYFTPIVNSPEVAILGVSRSVYEPVYFNDDPTLPAGGFKPRLMMPLSLSYDHRVIDGADAIRFLRWVVNALENPFLLSLEG